MRLLLSIFWLAIFVVSHPNAQAQSLRQAIGHEVQSVVQKAACPECVKSFAQDLRRELRARFAEATTPEKRDMWLITAFEAAISRANPTNYREHRSDYDSIEAIYLSHYVSSYLGNCSDAAFDSVRKLQRLTGLETVREKVFDWLRPRIFTWKQAFEVIRDELTEAALTTFGGTMLDPEANPFLIRTQFGQRTSPVHGHRIEAVLIQISRHTKAPLSESFSRTARFLTEVTTPHPFLIEALLFLVRDLLEAESSVALEFFSGLRRLQNISPEEGEVPHWKILAHSEAEILAAEILLKKEGIASVLELQKNSHDPELRDLATLIVSQILPEMLRAQLENRSKPGHENEALEVCLHSLLQAEAQKQTDPNKK